jgi:hypothetical protein
MAEEVLDLIAHWVGDLLSSSYFTGTLPLRNFDQDIDLDWWVSAGRNWLAVMLLHQIIFLPV